MDAGSDHSRLVHDILCTTWDDFYSWEQEDFHRTIEALRSPEMVTKTPSLLPRWIEIQPHPGPIRDSDQDTPDGFRSWTEAAVSELSLDEIEIMEYRTIDGPDSSTTKDFSFISVTLGMPQGIPACPQYEACTPLDQNIKLGDDPDALGFLRFADDPAFDLMDYANGYECLAWQRMRNDPSWAAIIIATWNDCTNRGLSVETIETVLNEIFPLKLLDEYSLRDFPPWNHPLLNPFGSGDKADEFNLVMMERYCRLCGFGYCFRHCNPNPPEKILLTDNSSDQELNTLCSELCFLSLDSSSKVSAVETTWTDSGKQLEFLLSYLPDMTPCCLASISRKPCTEVFMYRELLLDKPTETENAPDKGPSLTDAAVPCSHNGPCNKESCLCHTTPSGCTSRCLCDKKCPQRWKGCQCKKRKTRSKPACSPATRCPCLKLKIECDPDICINCQPICLSGTCSNVQLQLGQAKRTSVRQSQWGFGLFMEESVQSNEMIDEYLGEIIFDPTAESRGYLQRHRGRNYLFELNEEYRVSIDSSYAGNATRYINHAEFEEAGSNYSKENRPNCYSRVWHVYGEERIQIIAGRNIKAGEELFMDYGEKFEIKTPDENNENEIENESGHWPVEVDNLSDETYKEGSSGPSSS